jgi:hypothetical protein
MKAIGRRCRPWSLEAYARWASCPSRTSRSYGANRSNRSCRASCARRAGKARCTGGSRRALLRKHAPVSRLSIGLLICARLEGNVSGTRVRDQIMKAIGRRCRPRTLEAYARWPGCTSRTSRSYGADRSNRSRRASCARRAGKARGTGGSRRALLRKHGPVSGLSIGLLICARLEGNVSRTRIGDQIMKAIGRGGRPWTLEAYARWPGCTGWTSGSYGANRSNRSCRASYARRSSRTGCPCGSRCALLRKDGPVSRLSIGLLVRARLKRNVGRSGVKD